MIARVVRDVPAFFFLLLLILAWGGARGVAPLAGQPPDAAETDPASTGSGLVFGVLSVGPGVDLLKRTPVPVVRLGGLIEFSSGFRLGATGSLPLAGVPVSSEPSPDRAELHLGYGGVRAEAGRRDSSWRASLTVAAATARIRSPLVGATIASKNFIVVEPGISRGLGARGPFHYGVALSGRFALGDPDLPGVPSGDLHGMTLLVTGDLVRRR